MKNHSFAHTPAAVKQPAAKEQTSKARRLRMALAALALLILAAAAGFVAWGETPAQPMPEALAALQVQLEAEHLQLDEQRARAVSTVRRWTSIDADPDRRLAVSVGAGRGIPFVWGHALQCSMRADEAGGVFDWRKLVASREATLPKIRSR